MYCIIGCSACEINSIFVCFLINQNHKYMPSVPHSISQSRTNISLLNISRYIIHRTVKYGHIEIPKMWIQPSLLTFALGLLPCLTNAIAQVPVFSTLKDPFVLSVQDGYQVILKYHEEAKVYVPVLSHTKVRLPDFRLTAGNVTTGGDKLSAFYGPVPRIYPPVLNAIRFRKHPSEGSEIPFNAVSHHSGILRLWGLNGRKLPIKHVKILIHLRNMLILFS